jgi:pyrroloquinoline quinone biosynthesis protein B
MVKEQGGVWAIVLGMMQDGGLPHIGCVCARCKAATADPSLARYAASLAIVDRRGAARAVWIIDAAPDIGRQIALLATDLGPHPERAERLRQPDGIFLTHAHMGHTGGLPQLGPEAMAVEQLKIFALQGVLKLLQDSLLWRPVTSRLDLKPVVPGEAIQLAPQLAITAMAVPHRDEWQAGTAGYRIDGPRQSLLYVPDIDDWGAWPEAELIIEAADVALVDASFFSEEELDGRAPVAHPLVPNTLARFGALSSKLVLTHVNHTNPILDDGSRQQKAVLAAGAQIARRGLVFEL